MSLHQAGKWSRHLPLVVPCLGILFCVHPRFKEADSLASPSSVGGIGGIGRIVSEA